MGLISNLDDVLKRFETQKKRGRKRMAKRMKGIVFTLHKEILARTPVNTGATVVNFIWSMDQPIIETKEPIPDGSPIGTNSMPLGPEPRRRANEQEATETLLNLDFEQPFTKVYLSNTSEAIVGLEAGVLPNDPRFTPRSPQGMIGVSVAYVHALMEAGQL